jgi:hypothetical protein
MYFMMYLMEVMIVTDILSKSLKLIRYLIYFNFAIQMLKMTVTRESTCK